MKIRNGFVSNSSSSSFVMIGIRLDYDETNIQSTLETLGLNKDEIIEIIQSIGDSYWELDKYIPDTVAELKIKHNSDCQILYIGKELNSIEDAVNFSKNDVTEIAHTLNVEEHNIHFINDEINY